MSKSNATENDVLAYIFKATAFPWNAVTNLAIHLHTADPGEAGISTTSEATYTGYSAAGIIVPRSAAGWTVAGSVASNAAVIGAPKCTGGSDVLTHVSITPEGSTQILYSGQLGDSLAVSNLIKPQFEIGDLTIAED